MEKTSRHAVSVILPTYNRERLVGRSIRSVLDQTYTDFELIVVDDGSKDNTEEIVRAFNDPRIRYFKHSSNRGVSAARNTGMSHATGSYIAFQDSDDEWFPQKLEKQMALFKQDQEGNLGLVACGYLWISETEEHRCVPDQNRLNYEQLLSHFGSSGVGTQQFLLKRDLTSPELYFDENLQAWEDWDLLLRISRICRIDCAKEILAKCYRHDGPQLDNPNSRLKARSVLLRKYASDLKARHRAVSFSHRQSALDYYELGQMRGVRHHLKVAIKAYPCSPDLYLNFFVSLSGRRSFQFFLACRSTVSLMLRQTTRRPTNMA